MARLPESWPTITLPALTATLRPRVIQSTRRTPELWTSVSMLATFVCSGRPVVRARLGLQLRPGGAGSGLLLARHQPVEALRERHARGVEEAPLEDRDERQGPDQPVRQRV